MRRKQNFETQQSWHLLFAFSPPLFFRFSCSFFFSRWAFSRLRFRKAFRTLGLGERKDRWATEQDFHGDFQVNVTWFFASFSGVLDWIVLILVWFERSLHSAHVSGQSCPWSLKLMTSPRVERTWIRTGGYRRFRGEWVNTQQLPSKFKQVLVCGSITLNYQNLFFQTSKNVASYTRVFTAQLNLQRSKHQWLSTTLPFRTILTQTCIFHVLMYWYLCGIEVVFHQNNKLLNDLRQYNSCSLLIGDEYFNS